MTDINITCSMGRHAVFDIPEPRAGGVGAHRSDLSAGKLLYDVLRDYASPSLASLVFMDALEAEVVDAIVTAARRHWYTSRGRWYDGHDQRGWHAGTARRPPIEIIRLTHSAAAAALAVARDHADELRALASSAPPAVARALKSAAQQIESRALWLGDSRPLARLMRRAGAFLEAEAAQ
jgi:hypothetical protein